MESQQEAGLAQEANPLWYSKLVLENSQNEANRLLNSVQALKNQANTLFCCVILLSFALLLLMDIQTISFVMCGIMLVLLSMIGILCIHILLPIPWKHISITSDKFKEIWEPSLTEQEKIEAIIKEYSENNQSNKQVLLKTQQRMKRIWILLLLIPIIITFILILFSPMIIANMVSYIYFNH